MELTVSYLLLREMSDSELSEVSATPPPPDRELEKSLRREVAKAARAGLDYSYNSIRAASELKLSLRRGFYKSHEEWANKSKEIILDQMVFADRDVAT